VSVKEVTRGCPKIHVGRKQWIPKGPAPIVQSVGKAKLWKNAFFGKLLQLELV
jgi:hypothetical protein